mmetsp:Transcript_124619/g.323776  ORF Transcript_124619/g.323776 Transcript_124619/m.323776 type:complete len:99 (-) Transcript_124619:143-439(-)
MARSSSVILPAAAALVALGLLLSSMTAFIPAAKAGGANLRAQADMGTAAIAGLAAPALFIAEPVMADEGGAAATSGTFVLLVMAFALIATFQGFGVLK